MRRFTRLTNGFSKKFDNHCAAVALHVMHYNFVRVHQTLRTTPAVAAGLATRPWSLAELVRAALAEVDNDPEPTDDGTSGEDESNASRESEPKTGDAPKGVTVDMLTMLGATPANDNAAPREVRIGVE
jgi:hypothetical protein